MGSDGWRGAPAIHDEDAMITAIIVTIIITAALGCALRAGRGGELISHRPYNNRYSDASGAREDHL